MSIKVTGFVWGHSQQRGEALIVMLAIADHAHDDGGGAFPTVSSLAQKARIAPRSVQRILTRLADSGELEVQYNRGPNRTNLYRVRLENLVTPTKGHPEADDTPTKGHPATGDTLDPDIGDTDPDTGDTLTPTLHEQVTVIEPSLEPSIEPSDDKSESTKNCKINVDWPEWYTILSVLPGFITSVERAEKWLLDKGITTDLAEKKAYGLRAWWNPKKHGDRDAWQTFQAWCREGTNSTHAAQARSNDGNIGTGSPKKPSSFAKYGRRSDKL